MKRNSLGAAAALALVAAASSLAAVPAGDGQPRATTQAPRGVTREQRRMVSRGSFFRFSSPGPGWTHAQVRRMAKKARNRKRNRLAHRGK